MKFHTHHLPMSWTFVWKVLSLKKQPQKMWEILACEIGGAPWPIKSPQGRDPWTHPQSKWMEKWPMEIWDFWYVPVNMEPFHKTPFWKIGKSSTPNYHFQVRAVNLRGCKLLVNHLNLNQQKIILKGHRVGQCHPNPTMKRSVLPLENRSWRLASLATDRCYERGRWPTPTPFGQHGIEFLSLKIFRAKSPCQFFFETKFWSCWLSEMCYFCLGNMLKLLSHWFEVWTCLWPMSKEESASQQKTQT